MSNLGGYIVATKSIKKLGGPKWSVTIFLILGLIIFIAGVFVGLLF